MEKNPKGICEMLGRVAFCGRRGDYPQASSLLNESAQEIQSTLLSGEKMKKELIQKIAYSLETLIMMQKQDDWVAVADILEYEFIPLWNGLFETAKDW